MMKVLHLPLKAKWYNMIESGKKTEEYRRINPHWAKRLMRRYGNFDWCKKDYACHGCIWKCGTKNYTHVRFRYGYTRRTMLYDIESISTGRGIPEWGAPEDNVVFIIRLGKRYEERTTD